MIDFPALAFAIAAAATAGLAAVAAGTLRRMPCAYLRLAATLAGAAAVANGISALVTGAEASQFATAVSLIVAALVPPLVAFAAMAEERRLFSPAATAALLGAACLAGLAGAVFALAPIAFAPLAAAVVALALFALRGWRRARWSAVLLGAGAVAFLASAAAMTGGGAESRLAFALFLSAGLLGCAVALARRSDAALEKRARAKTGSILIGSEH